MQFKSLFAFVNRADVDNEALAKCFDFLPSHYSIHVVGLVLVIWYALNDTLGKYKSY